MTKETVSVSIVTANYNNGIYLNDFIHSIENSTVTPLELIIIDDGSTDNSVSILDSFSHLVYLKVIKFIKNRGFCNALNEGITNVSGKYILRTDPDDIISKDRIKLQFEFLENNREIDIVGSNAIYFNKHKNEIFRSNFPVDHEIIKSRFINGEHGVLHGSTLIRTTVFKKFNYKQKNFKVEDYDIFSRIINAGYKFSNISKPLIKVRIHSESVSINIEYSTIKNTFNIRDKIFRTKTNPLKVRFYFWYIINYKRFLISTNSFLKLLFLCIAIISYPSKLFRRIL